jgi:hypothetical protein
MAFLNKCIYSNNVNQIVYITGTLLLLVASYIIYTKLNFVKKELTSCRSSMRD